MTSPAATSDFEIFPLVNKSAYFLLVAGHRVGPHPGLLSAARPGHAIACARRRWKCSARSCARRTSRSTFFSRMDSKLKTLDQAQAEVDQAAASRSPSSRCRTRCSPTRRRKTRACARCSASATPRPIACAPAAWSAASRRAGGTTVQVNVGWAGRSRPRQGPAGRLAARRRRQDRQGLALRDRRHPDGEPELQHLRHGRGHARPGHRARARAISRKASRA